MMLMIFCFCQVAAAGITTASTLPFNYTGYNRFPSFYFGASPGPQSSTELDLVRRFALTGWGWQQGYQANNGHLGELAGSSAASALRAIAPVGSINSPDFTFVYRQSESLFTYYSFFGKFIIGAESSRVGALSRDTIMLFLKSRVS